MPVIDKEELKTNSATSLSPRYLECAPRIQTLKYRCCVRAHTLGAPTRYSEIRSALVELMRKED